LYYSLIFGLLRISIGLSVFGFVANEYKQITIRSLSNICNIWSGIRWAKPKVILNYSTLPSQQVWQGCDDDLGIWKFRPSKLILKLNRIGSMSESYPLHNWVVLLTLDNRQIPIDIRVFVNVKFPPCWHLLTEKAHVVGSAIYTPPFQKDTCCTHCYITDWKAMTKISKPLWMKCSEIKAYDVSKISVTHYYSLLLLISFYLFFISQFFNCITIDSDEQDLNDWIFISTYFLYNFKCYNQWLNWILQEMNYRNCSPIEFTLSSLLSKLGDKIFLVSLVLRILIGLMTTWWPHLRKP